MLASMDSSRSCWPHRRRMINRFIDRNYVSFLTMTGIGVLIIWLIIIYRQASPAAAPTRKSVPTSENIHSDIPLRDGQLYWLNCKKSPDSTYHHLKTVGQDFSAIFTRLDDGSDFIEYHDELIVKRKDDEFEVLKLDMLNTPTDLIVLADLPRSLKVDVEICQSKGSNSTLLSITGMRCEPFRRVRDFILKERTVPSFKRIVFLPDIQFDPVRKDPYTILQDGELIVTFPKKWT